MLFGACNKEMAQVRAFSGAVKLREGSLAPTTNTPMARWCDFSRCKLSCVGSSALWQTWSMSWAWSQGGNIRIMWSRNGGESLSVPLRGYGHTSPEILSQPSPAPQPHSGSRGCKLKSDNKVVSNFSELHFVSHILLIDNCLGFRDVVPSQLWK